MLFTCLPEGAQIPGRFPGPVHARGKWFTVDIHCHLLTVKAEEMVKEAGLSMDWQPRFHFANEQTREVNREQARRTRVQFTDIATRLADMDRMGIDIQAITPSPAQTFYGVPADHQHHRQSARHDSGGASPDLRRRVARPPEPEAGVVAWRRLSAGLFRPH
jgi:hypothetical protein